MATDLLRSSVVVPGRATFGLQGIPIYRDSERRLVTGGIGGCPKGRTPRGPRSETAASAPKGRDLAFGGSGPRTMSGSESGDCNRAKTLILGLGNDIRGDDAIGLLVTRKLQKQCHNKGFYFQESGEMGFALLDHIVGFNELIIIDSVQTGKFPPGHLYEFCKKDLKTFPSISPHAAGIGEILSLGKTLGLTMPRKVKIFAIEVKDPFTLATQMTPELDEAFPLILKKIILSLCMN